MARPRFSIKALRRLRGTAAYEREWRRVFEHFDPQLAEYFRRRVNGADELGDLLGGLWDRATRGIRHFSGRGSLEGWLVILGRSVLQDGYRAADRERRGLGRQTHGAERETPEADVLSTMRGFAKLDREAWVDPRPLERLAAVSEREYIERRLTPGQRRFVALRIDEDLTHIEIAQRLGYSSPKVAEQTWNRIRERVRAITHAVASPTSQRASARATALAEKRAAKEAAAKAKAVTAAASGEAAPGADPTATIGGHSRGGMRTGARPKQSVLPGAVTKPRRRAAPAADPPGRGSSGGSSGSPPLP